MRIAVLSDVHGNSIALDAVLADCRDADGWWVLGDLVALGPDPLGVLERLERLPNVRATRGNTDRYTVTGDLPRPAVEDARDDPRVVSQVLESAASFAWTRGAVTAGGRYEWLAALPLELRETLPDGTRVLGVHASPGRDDGDGVVPAHGDAELSERFAGADADLVLVGHTHRRVDRSVDGMRIVNLGCVSLPPEGVDPRASYVVLDADEHGHTLEHRLVEYDRAAVVRLLARVRHPSIDFLSPFFR